MNYVLHLLVLLELSIVLSLSLNLMVGYGGLLSLAHAAFYGLGAYLTVLLVIDGGFDFFLALLLAVAGTALLSLLVSLASMRLRGDHFVLTTLAFQVIVFSVLYNWVQVTRGPFGISGIPRPTLWGTRLDSLLSFSLFGLFLSALLVCFIIVVFRSAFARSLKSIRDDALAATSLGKKVMWFEVRSVAIAASCAAAAGAIYATYVRYIDPTSFDLEQSILLLSMVILGGTGNVRGSIAGAVLLVFLPELLKLFPISDAVAANLRMAIYGFLLIALMRFRPKGIVGSYAFD